MSSLTSKVKDGWARWKLAHFYLRDIQDVDVSTTLPTSGQALVWNSTDNKWEPGAVGGSLLPLSQQSASYTLVLADAETCVEFTAGSAVNCTIPPHSSQAFLVGAWVQIRQYGAGQVTFVQGAGVTIDSPAGAVKTCQQYTTVVAHQRAIDEWVLVGDLV